MSDLVVPDFPRSMNVLILAKWFPDIDEDLFKEKWFSLSPSEMKLFLTTIGLPTYSTYEDLHRMMNPLKDPPEDSDRKIRLEIYYLLQMMDYAKKNYPEGKSKLYFYTAHSFQNGGKFGKLSEQGKVAVVASSSEMAQLLLAILKDIYNGSINYIMGMSSPSDDFIGEIIHYHTKDIYYQSVADEKTIKLYVKLPHEWGHMEGIFSLNREDIEIWSFDRIRNFLKLYN